MKGYNYRIILSIGVNAQIADEEIKMIFKNQISDLLNKYFPTQIISIEKE